jgi:hypothetical protein
MQLYFTKGNYGNRQYSEKHSVTLILVIFCAEGNRRGVGFDKPSVRR